MKKNFGITIAVKSYQELSSLKQLVYDGQLFQNLFGNRILTDGAIAILANKKPPSVEPDGLDRFPQFLSGLGPRHEPTADKTNAPHPSEFLSGLGPDGSKPPTVTPAPHPSEFLSGLGPEEKVHSLSHDFLIANQFSGGEFQEQCLMSFHRSRFSWGLNPQKSEVSVLDRKTIVTNRRCDSSRKP